MLTNQQLQTAVPHALSEVRLPALGSCEAGKVRDSYPLSAGRRLLITTDRVSAFDQVLGLIPYKGQVLNQLSAWWFEKTRDIIDNHLLELPDPNAMLVRNAEPLPVEVIVRGFITGVTSTSLWTLYEQGVDRPYGLELPTGLRKDDRLPSPVITPTTKATGGAHDERLTSAEVTERGLVEPALWQRVQEAALALFARGQQVAASVGLLLVDTKYEFGLIDGHLAVIDEIHTPDSSRYWVAESWQRSQQTGEAPEHFDKELLRQWLKSQGYSGDGPFGGIPEEVAVRLAAHYIAVYERLTGSAFAPGELPPLPRITGALAAFVD